jgi:rhodanese-related sulfurtransferase
MKHYIIALVSIISFATCNAQDSGVKILKQNDFEQLSNKENVVVVDVRTPREVSAGYISEADYFIDINGSNFEAEVAKLDKEKTYIMYCRSGARSGRAASYLINAGFSDVYNLEGGILNYTEELKK